MAKKNEQDSLAELKKLADAPENLPEPPTPEEIEAEDKPLDAVIVVKQIEPDGSLTTNVLTNGNVQQTEIETLLGLGLKAWRAHLGV